MHKETENEPSNESAATATTSSITTQPILFDHVFKLPIYYNENRQPLKQNIVTDLELKQTIDASANSIYSFVFNINKQHDLEEAPDKNELSTALIPQFTEHYTTDILFLKDYQTLLSNFSTNNQERKQKVFEESNILSLWREIKDDVEFKSKYYYLDWPMLEFMNKSHYYLQGMSIYNLLSPLISLIMPIIILILPFFIIKMKGVEVTMSEYIDVLKVVVKNNALGRLFTEFHEVELNQKIYLLVSACFYVFSVYQNIMVCIRFYRNMHKIHDYFQRIQVYLKCTIDSMNSYLNLSNNLITHKLFNEELQRRKGVLEEFYNKINCISTFRFSLKKLFEIGHILKFFYEFFCDPDYHDSMLYSFGFHGYLGCLEGLSLNIQERKVGLATLSFKKKERNKEKKKANKKLKDNAEREKHSNEFINSYYAVLKDEQPVKNTIRLDKNIIITGPNASGKTTVLKSTLINIILTQQFGCGFYESATFTPYKHLHCYLNIPDTSGRDSLFQAEARRCKEIIDIIQQEKKEEEEGEGEEEGEKLEHKHTSINSHFCAFDELFSGTNPEEATSSATAFMKYLVKQENVTCILTTHFYKMCKTLKHNKLIQNCHMEVTERENNILQFHFRLKKGISTIKGGLSVLKGMNYPKAILDSI